MLVLALAVDDLLEPEPRPEGVFRQAEIAVFSWEFVVMDSVVVIIYGHGMSRKGGAGPVVPGIVVDSGLVLAILMI